MTDLEKIIAEIGRRKEINFNVSQQCRVQEDEEIISYIKDLMRRKKKKLLVVITLLLLKRQLGGLIILSMSAKN